MPDDADRRPERGPGAGVGPDDPGAATGRDAGPSAAAGRDTGPGAATGSGPAGRPEAPDPDRRALITWLWRLPVVLAVGAGGVGLYEAIRVHFEKRSPAAHPTFVPRPETTVAPLAHFVAPWSATVFALPGTPPVPAVAVRLPGPIVGGLEVRSGVGADAAHLAAFSRVCTHKGCIVELNRDLEAIDFGFNYTTDHPALTCPCHLSVFDPERAGRAVSGPAVEPLPRVELRLRGGTVVAVGLERT